MHKPKTGRRETTAFFVCWVGIQVGKIRAWHLSAFIGWGLLANKHNRRLFCIEHLCKKILDPSIFVRADCATVHCY